MFSSSGRTANESWPPTSRPTRSPSRDRLILLAILAVVTAGAWALTVYQATTMDMPMGVMPREASGVPESPAPAAMNEMDAMAMDDAANMAATGMAGAGWSWAAFGAFVLAWAVMMAAMMFPAAAPMIAAVPGHGYPTQGSRPRLRPDLGLRRRLPPGLDGHWGNHLAPRPGRQRRSGAVRRR